MQQSEIYAFIQQNAFGLYQYINEEVLKGIGVMHPDYFVKLIQNVFIDNIDVVLKDKHLMLTTIPYVMFAYVFGTGHIAFTSLRKESIDFEQINKEARVYYNYVRFSIEKNQLKISLMQSKIGGMPIDADIVKFTKEVTINKDGLNNYLSLESNNETISQKINTLFKQ